jgi:hypothetical protein
VIDDDLLSSEYWFVEPSLYFLASSFKTNISDPWSAL